MAARSEEQRQPLATERMFAIACLKKIPQVFSLHNFLGKLPPRVSQTAHWLDITTVLRQNGYVHFAQIVFLQTICGTLNEVLRHYSAFTLPIH